MRKIIVMLVALCAAVTVNATILRVSNVNGSSAPYSTIQAAHDAANEGDTIMVDGSNTRYEKTVISKRLVLIGPGYWINDNGLVNESVPTATAEFTVLAAAAGTVIEGFTFKYVNTWLVDIHADNCVVRRCYFYDHVTYAGIHFSRDKKDDSYVGPNPKGAVITQNFFAECGIRTNFLVDDQMTNVNITNNIFLNNDGGEYDIRCMSSSYIAYNTMIGKNDYYLNFNSVYASTIEHNIIKGQSVWYPNIHIKDNNEWDDNITIAPTEVAYNIDKDIRDLGLTKDVVTSHGAFAGDSPYVLSGIPAAPVIQDLVMPTTVEKGSKMKVSIKVGIQK